MVGLVLSRVAGNNVGKKQCLSPRVMQFTRRREVEPDDTQELSERSFDEVFWEVVGGISVNK